MESKKTIPSYIRKHLEKRQKLLELYYIHGRPIYNHIHDKKHMILNTAERGVCGSYL